MINYWSGAAHIHKSEEQKSEKKTNKSITMGQDLPGATILVSFVMTHVGLLPFSVLVKNIQ